MTQGNDADSRTFASLTEKADAEDTTRQPLSYRTLLPTIQLPSELEEILQKSLGDPITLISQAAYYSSPTHDYLAVKAEVGSAQKGRQWEGIRHRVVVIKKRYGANLGRAEVFLYDGSLSLLLDGNEKGIETRLGKRLYPMKGNSDITH